MPVALVAAVWLCPNHSTSGSFFHCSTLLACCSPMAPLAWSASCLPCCAACLAAVFMRSFQLVLPPPAAASPSPAGVVTPPSGGGGGAGAPTPGGSKVTPG